MSQVNNPLHGVTLEALLTQLEAEMGWKTMAQHVSIRCFESDPSIKSSLKFLRRTPWAREKVEQLYLEHLAKNNAASDDPWAAHR